MGVTEAEGTEEVGVLDLLPVLLGVAATESDSDPSSFRQSRDVRQGSVTLEVLKRHKPDENRTRMVHPSQRIQIKSGWKVFSQSSSYQLTG